MEKVVDGLLAVSSTLADDTVEPVLKLELLRIQQSKRQDTVSYYRYNPGRGIKEYTPIYPTLEVLEGNECCPCNQKGVRGLVSLGVEIPL